MSNNGEEEDKTSKKGEEEEGGEEEESTMELSREFGSEDIVAKTVVSEMCGRQIEHECY